MSYQCGGTGCPRGCSDCETPAALQERLALVAADEVCKICHDIGIVFPDGADPYQCTACDGGGWLCVAAAPPSTKDSP